MAKCSTAALLTALEQLSEHSARRNDRSNWISTLLVAKRMQKMNYGLTTPGSDRGAEDVFVLLPNNPKGRVNPFLRPTSKVRWLKVAHTGRSTVWNTGTRTGSQRVLFNDEHFENGLADDAIDVLLANLGTEEPLPARDALAVLLTRDHDWPSEPSRAELHAAAADFVDLTVADFERITEDRELGVPVLGEDEWSPASIEASDAGPPVVPQTAQQSAWQVVNTTAEELAADPAAVSARLTEAIAVGPPPEVAIEDLATLFTEFLGTYGIAIESADEVLDLLASTLSSQLVLMAGPSGSGKSLMAAALSAFFATADRRCRIEAARLLAKREELLGYFSYLADSTFVAYDPVLELLRVASSSETTPPCITIEEANLSPIEGYLSPLVHGLGGLTSETVTVPLHSQPDPVKSQADDDIPPRLDLTPYPRFFATINVDAESPAPARKVVSRSCVVLFEAPTFDTALASSDSLVKPGVQEADGMARGALVEPTAAFERYSESGSDSYQRALRARADILRQAIGIDVITHRQVTKSLLYMAWYVELARADEDDEDVARTAADNAVLHFVLPVLPAQHFARALAGLQAAAPRGVLKDRIERLNIALQGQHFGPPPDFWGALS